MTLHITDCCRMMCDELEGSVTGSGQDIF